MRCAATLVAFTVCGLCYGRCAEAFDTVINISLQSQTAPKSIGSNTQLNVTRLGTLPEGFQAGEPDGTSSNIEVNFSGNKTGSIRANAGSVVNLSNGTVWGLLTAENGSVVNLSGTVTFVNFLQAVGGGTITISGGSVYSSSAAVNGSHINMLGGVVKGSFTATGSSIIQFSGGTVGDAFRIGDSSELHILGEDFRINGVSIAGIGQSSDSVRVNVPINSVLSGTLADGTPFAFSAQDGDELPDGCILLTRASVPAATLGQIIVNNQSQIFGARQGQHLKVSLGGKLREQFNAGYESAVEISGGDVGAYFEALNADIKLVDGSIGDAFSAFYGSVVEISGGKVGANFDALNGSVVTISGGQVGPYFNANAGSHVTIAGGTFGKGFEVREGGSVEISGGKFAERFYIDDGAQLTIAGGSFGILRAYDGSATNLCGKAFMLNGVPIEGLDYGIPMSIGQREVTLSGILADGSSFSFDLNSINYDSTIFGAGLAYDFFGIRSTLTLTLVPEPAPALLTIIAILFFDGRRLEKKTRMEPFTRTELPCA